MLFCFEKWGLMIDCKTNDFMTGKHLTSREIRPCRWNDSGPPRKLTWEPLLKGKNMYKSPIFGCSSRQFIEGDHLTALQTLQFFKNLNRWLVPRDLMTNFERKHHRTCECRIPDTLTNKFLRSPKLLTILIHSLINQNIQLIS